MIQLLVSGDDLTPAVFCDLCGDVIRNTGMGMAIFPYDTGSAPRLHEVLHVHKGRCLEQTEEALRDARPTEELVTHLRGLARLGR